MMRIGKKMNRAALGGHGFLYIDFLTIYQWYKLHVKVLFCQCSPMISSITHIKRPGRCVFYEGPEHNSIFNDNADNIVFI